MRLANISKEDTQNQFQDYRSLWLHHNTDKKKIQKYSKSRKEKFARTSFKHKKQRTLGTWVTPNRSHMNSAGAVQKEDFTFHSKPDLL